MKNLFSPITIKNYTFKNRIVLPPMCMYSADEEGNANDFHVIHYATRAIGQMGLIIVESTGVVPDGRITNHDLGLWHDDHVKGLRWITKQIKAHGAIAGIQLNHAGRKSKAAEVKRAPSAIPFGDYDVPEPLTYLEINALLEDYKQAARRALEANFDLIEIHAAHGYLIHEFISPLSNQREDDYGGELLNRARLLYEVIHAVKSVWPDDKLLSVRISAEDYEPNGIHPADWVKILQHLEPGLVDIIHVSSGGLIPKTLDDYPGYQLMFAKKIKRETHFHVIAGGLIEDPIMADGVLSSDEADFIFFGRLALKDPYFPLRFASRMRYDIEWPEQYKRAKKQV